MSESHSGGGNVQKVGPNPETLKKRRAVLQIVLCYVHNINEPQVRRDKEFRYIGILYESAETRDLSKTTY